MPPVLPAGSGGLDIDEAQRRIGVREWSKRATWVRLLASGEFSALLPVRQGVSVLLTGYNHAATARMELWAGEPDTTDGLAVLVQDWDLAGIARIPLCSCGERGCGNASTQFVVNVAAGELQPILEILGGLPDLPKLRVRRPDGVDTWDGRVEGGQAVV